LNLSIHTPLRIGFINENLGGHASFQSRLLESLENDSSVICDTLNVPSRGFVRRVLTSPLPLPDGWDFDVPLFRNQVGQSLAVTNQVKELVATNDVIHMYSQNAAPLNVRHLRKRPLIVSSDATCGQVAEKFPFRYPGYGSFLGQALCEGVEKHILRQATAIITQSEWARRAFIRDCSIPSDIVHVVRMGAPRPIKAVDRPARDLVKVVYVGASMNRKGGWLLIDVLADLLGREIELHLVTRENVPARPGVVVYNDVQPNDGRIEKILLDADIFALPTDMDMSPNAILEAMACGLPIVSTQCGGIPEMVDEGRNGFLTRVGEKEGLRAALLSLIHSPDRRRAFGEASRDILLNRFDQTKSAAMFTEIVFNAASQWKNEHGPH
jgi:glycosyltransferase involved in cell wall biosynthesis